MSDFYHYLHRNHPFPLKRFINEKGHVAAAVTDSEVRVVEFNEQFARLAATPEVEGTPLSELIKPAEGESIALPSPGTTWNVDVQFVNGPPRRNAYEMHAFNDNGRYVLFFDQQSGLSEGDAANMGKLNEELTDLTRQLQKKTRELRRANETITHLSRTDVLTELPNRRDFKEKFEASLSAARRHDFPLTLAMADLDHFKSINDTFGHDAGDEVLKAFADILKGASRKEDLPARWGGEEFVVMMPHTAVGDAEQVVERIRQKLENVSCPGVDRSVTASFGITECREGDGLDDAMARADRALYRAKEEGRNRIVTDRAVGC